MRATMEGKQVAILLEALGTQGLGLGDRDSGSGDLSCAWKSHAREQRGSVVVHGSYWCTMVSGQEIGHALGVELDVEG